MQDSGGSAKQQVVDRIKQSTNILVTVSSGPSVDALSAALGLTLMLNKMDKHATAVFSGAIPPAINFLEPGKTFEHNVDSLRDFIIALDKEKADRLRYKVENDVVRIFITPYRTTITQSDLQFSQGDFNVDLIIALGVERREELDQAITAHGRILHDATVVTVNAVDQKSSLGSIDWQDGSASSLSEMMVAMSEPLQPNILDQQISTALLTGIVAATGRFSNQHTTPRVMTTAAQLMASGANQQLIANSLQVATETKSSGPEKIPTDTSTKVVDGKAAASADGEMHIRHEESKPKSESLPTAPEVMPEPEIPFAAPADNGFNDLKRALEEDTDKVVGEPKRPNKASINSAQPMANPEDQEKKKDKDSYITSKPSWMGRNVQPPTMGGTLNATSEQAMEDKMHDEQDQRNRALLTHGGPVEGAAATEMPAREEPKKEKPAKVSKPEVQAPAEPEQPSLPPVTEPAPKPEPPAPVAVPAPEPVPPAPVVGPPLAPTPPLMDKVALKTEPSIEQLEQEAKAKESQEAHEAPIAPALPASDSKPDLEAARAAVSEALAAQPFSPVGNPTEAVGAQPFPPVQHEPVTNAPAMGQPSAEQPALPPLPPVPPMPDFSTLPPAPGQPAMNGGQAAPVVPPVVPPVPEPQQPQAPQTPPPNVPPQAQPPADPRQFKIPGQ